MVVVLKPRNETAWKS